MRRSRKEIRRRRKVWQSEYNKKRHRKDIPLVIATIGISLVLLIILGLALVNIVYANEDRGSSNIAISKEEEVKTSSLTAGVTKVIYDNLNGTTTSENTPFIRDLVIEPTPYVPTEFKSTIQEDMERQKAEDARIQEEEARRQQELMDTYAYHPELPYTEADLEWLAKIVYCEAGGEPSDILQQYVASVVINRANSSMYSNTIEGVIFDKGQYAPAISGKVNDCSYTERAYNNAKYILDNGSILPEYVIFQAEFTQGSGTYDTIPIRNGEATMYFCY